jgi:CheY-like chemotaxis protein
VLTAANGELGVALAERFEPDAVVLDIGLPAMDGFEVGKKLSELPATKNALLIAVSGYSLKRFRDLGAYSVFRHYLLKPLSPQMLLYILERTLEDTSHG